MITIVDTGLANAGSVRSMLHRIGAVAEISADPAAISVADKLILPGVGAFDRGMQRLAELDLVGVLAERVHERRVPILGICLGMQLLTRGSEEGEMPGLGWIDADTVRFRPPPSGEPLRLPHMGWSEVVPRRPDGLLRSVEGELRFYHIHSYHVVCDHEADVLATTTYGYEFASAIQQENILGVQFHPEKSHRFGMAFLRRFAEVT